jgi:RimJ/RimL family protein N-acetyltransferase
VAQTEDIPFDWQPVAAPAPTTLRGRWVTLEPLSAERHTAALWQAVKGHDGLWTWLAEGPFPTEADLRQSIQQKQAGTSAVFLAIVPTEPRIPEGAGPFQEEARAFPEGAGAIQEGAGAFMPLKEGENARPSGPAPAKAAGWASYMRIEPAHGVIEVGNIMMSPSLQRTTAATEAMYLMARHVFEFLGYRRYEWKCNALNKPSRRAALRLGFTFEGIFRQHMVVKGRSRDTAWFAMLDHDWPARKQAFESWLNPANFDGEGNQRQSLSQIFGAQR